MFSLTSDEEEQAIQKYLKLPLKVKEFDTQNQLANEEVYMFRKKFHLTAMEYYSKLNAFQYKKRFMLYEPILAFIHGIKLFFQMGSEGFHASSSINQFLCDVGTNVHQ